MTIIQVRNNSPWTKSSGCLGVQRGKEEDEDSFQLWALHSLTDDCFFLSHHLATMGGSTGPVHLPMCCLKDSEGPESQHAAFSKAHNPSTQVRITDVFTQKQTLNTYWSFGLIIFFFFFYGSPSESWPTVRKGWKRSLELDCGNSGGPMSWNWREREEAIPPRREGLLGWGELESALKLFLPFGCQGFGGFGLPFHSGPGSSFSLTSFSARGFPDPAWCSAQSLGHSGERE